MITTIRNKQIPLTVLNDTRWSVQQACHGRSKPCNCRCVKLTLRKVHNSIVASVRNEQAKVFIDKYSVRIIKHVRNRPTTAGTGHNFHSIVVECLSKNAMFTIRRAIETIGSVNEESCAGTVDEHYIRAVTATVKENIVIVSDEETH